MKSFKTIISAGFLASALALAGCGGGGNDASEPGTVTPEVTAFQAALAAINSATSAADAQAAYDEVDKEAITGAEAAQLMAALDMTLMAFRVGDQEATLVTLAAAVDTSSLTTQADVDAANVAIAALQMAVDNAVDVSEAVKAQYIVQLNDARDEVSRAVAYIEKQGRIMDQKTALMNAADAIDTSVMADEDDILAAKEAIAALQTAVDNAVDVSEADKAMYETQLSDARNAVSDAEGELSTMKLQNMQRTRLTNAYDAAKMAVEAVMDDSADSVVADAEMAVKALEMAIADATDLSDDPALKLAEGRLADLEGDLMKAKDDRTTAMNEADKQRAEDFRKMAAKLYDAIVPNEPVDGTDGIATLAANGSTLDFGTSSDGDATASLKRGAVVDALGDWAGNSYSSKDHSATAYSMSADATPGAKFSTQYATELAATRTTSLLTGEVAVDTSTTAVQARVASSEFIRKSGKQEFTPPTGQARAIVSGEYHGVSGTYYCTPTVGEKCSATVADEGYTLANGTWVFRPGNADALVSETAGSRYAFGWWLNESGDDAEVKVFTYTNATAPSDISALRGSATYNGAAAGKYTLNHGVGGNNDSGHFTADATLKATFGATHAIEGTINGFKGSDGEDRKWSVALASRTLGSTGAVDAGTVGTDMTTTWTIDDVAASASGTWGGQLYGDDGGTPTTAIGTFGSTYNAIGKMVGAFGAELDN